MGPSHAACGAAAWVALTGTYTVDLADVSFPVGLGLMPVGDPGVVTGALICAGAALLTDLDHPGGTVARSLPPVSRWLAKGLSRLMRRAPPRHALASGLACDHGARRALPARFCSGGRRPAVERHGVRGGHDRRCGYRCRGVRRAGRRVRGSGAVGDAAALLPGQVWPLAAVLSVLLIACAVKVLAFVPDRLSHANWVVGILLGAFVAAHPRSIRTGSWWPWDSGAPCTW